MRRFAVIQLLIVFGLLNSVPIRPVYSLGTGFTYQGQLQENGAPAVGPANLRFSLWDAVVDGNQIGVSQLILDIPVTGGLFSVTLNEANQFSAAAFNGAERWLQVEECLDGACAAPDVFVPRQPLMGVPYSHYALTAPWSGLTGIPVGFADGVDDSGDSVWVKNGNTIGYSSGPVGIGTTSPDAMLQVNDGRIRIRESASSERWDLFYDPPTQKLFLQENAAFNHLVFTRGPVSSVGIGTDSPFFFAKLHVVTAVSGHYGIYAESPEGAAVAGVGNRGVLGQSGIDGGVGVIGISTHPGAYAGTFQGNVYVTGQVIEAGGAIKIDSPLDPENEYLSHSSVQSSELKNIYDGKVTTDTNGYAIITLPEWFEALNMDYRYQLTVIDSGNNEQFALAKVVREISGNCFTVRSSEPNVQISWQVTGVRQDAWAKAHPVEVQKAKPDRERGKYLAPELHGKSKEMGIFYRPGVQASLDRVSGNE